MVVSRENLKVVLSILGFTPMKICLQVYTPTQKKTATHKAA